MQPRIHSAQHPFRCLIEGTGHAAGVRYHHHYYVDVTPQYSCHCPCCHQHVIKMVPHATIFSFEKQVRMRTPTELGKDGGVRLYRLSKTTRLSVVPYNLTNLTSDRVVDTTRGAEAGTSPRKQT